MKNKLNKILFIITSLIAILILFLAVLCLVNKIGYLSEFQININETLELHNLDIEEIKNLFIVKAEETEINEEKFYNDSLINYIYTNESITNYSYHFKIKYYSKVFRHSDIYGVYINTNKIMEDNNFIKDIKMDTEIGSPFGNLISSKIIDFENIDNIDYKLKLKLKIIVPVLILFFMLLLFIYIIYDFKFNFKYRYAYILIIFLCFLIMPNIIYKVFYDKFDHTNYENRKFTEKPDFDIYNLDKYPNEYENYFNDYIPFRNEFKKIKSLMDIFVFNNSTERTIGKNKWLFADWGMDLMYIGMENVYFTNEELEEAKNNLLHFRDELRKRNIDFIFMICNDKQFIYTNYMPDYIKRKTELSPTDEFVKYIRDNTDIKILYPKDELMKYKDKYQLYFKYDSHWNFLGGYVAYTQLLDKLSNDYIPINKASLIEISNSNLIDVNAAGYNDLTGAFALSKASFFNDDARYIIGGYSFHNYIKTNIINWANFTTISKNHLNEIYVFILRDSYGSAMVPYISRYFNMATYAHFDEFKINDLQNISPDLFIFETVERSIKSRVLNTITNYKTK